MTNGWGNILDNGEQVLWQGRPTPGLSFRPTHPALVGMGVIFMAFSTFWMITASQAGGVFWMFGLIFFVVGANEASARMIPKSITAHYTWYSLTSKRAIIATEFPLIGRRMKSYPIGQHSPLEYFPGPLATIQFATETRRGNNSTYEVSIGFDRIKDGETVYRLLRDIQTGTIAQEAPHD